MRSFGPRMNTSGTRTSSWTWCDTKPKSVGTWKDSTRSVLAEGKRYWKCPTLKRNRTKCHVIKKRTRDVGPASQKCQNIFWKKETHKKKVVKMNYCVAKRDQSFPSELGSWSIRWPMISFVRHPALQKMPRLASAQEPKTRMNRVIECRLTRSTACVLLMPFHLGLSSNTRNGRIYRTGRKQMNDRL